MKLALAAALAAFGAAGAYLAQEPEVAPVDRTRFLFAAVIEGLAEDGFDPVLAGAIAENPKKWFVPDCPVCEPVLLAFRSYVTSCDRWWLKGDSWNGCRLEMTVVEALKSDDTPARHKAFEGLIQKYVGRRFERFRMTAGQKDRLQESLKIGMKEGLERLKESGSEDLFPSSCPSCEGAN